MPRTSRTTTAAAPPPAGRGWILDAKRVGENDVAAKREYFRDHMVAFRQRKKQSLQAMKEIHTALEAELQQRLAMRRAILLSGFTAHLYGHDNQAEVDEEDPSTRRHKLQEAYFKLVDEAEMHRAETQALQAELERFVKLRLMLHYELGLLQLGATADEIFVPTQLRGFFTYFVENEPPFYFEPFTHKECDDFMAEGYTRVRQLQDFFDQGRVEVKQTHCLGWRAQRSLERTHLPDGSDGPLVSRVRFTKRVRTPDGDALATLANLSAFAYRSLESAEGYARIQRTRFVSHTLQTFGNKHQVSVRNAPDAAGSTNIRYVHLLTHVEDQFTTAEGASNARSTVLMLAIDTPRHQLIREMMPSNPEIFWITEGTAFISFTQVDDCHLDIDYGNVTKCMSDEQAQYFMIELGAQLIRWENLVMPPRLLRF